jgi:autotransporter translocation and assembly factor TamB
MSQPSIEFHQVAVVVLFLSGLVGLHFFLTRKASGLRANLNRKRRILPQENRILQGGAILSLVEIDGRTLVVLHGKNQAAAFHDLKRCDLATEPDNDL